MFDTLRKFKLTSDSLEVDGHDISKMTRAVRYTYRVGQAPTLEVELNTGAEHVMGEAFVKYSSEADLEPYLISWLAGVDPAQLEQEVLSRLGGFDGQPVAAVYLEVLKEWAGG